MELHDKLEASGAKDPVEFLLSVQDDVTEDKRLRVEAAKAAAPFVRPKLAVQEQHDVDPNESKSDEEMKVELTAVIVKWAVDRPDDIVAMFGAMVNQAPGILDRLGLRKIEAPA